MADPRPEPAPEPARATSPRAARSEPVPRERSPALRLIAAAAFAGGMALVAAWTLRSPPAVPNEPASAGSVPAPSLPAPGAPSPAALPAAVPADECYRPGGGLDPAFADASAAREPDSWRKPEAGGKYEQGGPSAFESGAHASEYSLPAPREGCRLLTSPR